MGVLAVQLQSHILALQDIFARKAAVIRLRLLGNMDVCDPRWIQDVSFFVVKAQAATRTCRRGIDVLLPT